MMTCAVKGCTRSRYSRKLCWDHWYPSDDPARLICTIPDHQREHDNLGACSVCGVPTVVGLHPKARAALLVKRPDLANLAS